LVSFGVAMSATLLPTAVSTVALTAAS